ncbi:MAG: NfeD family protein [Verrucomicrobiae bacterium]|nr:NfeD family protein [Verrucomicrobiae bacterium]NNJ43626.1 NfeD family protein [Akkermansiaceae bacterium]
MELDTKMLWFIAGLAMILLEFVAPGVIIIFFGMGAWVVAMGMWIGWIESVPAQCYTFAIASLVMLFALRRFVTSWFVGGSLNGGAAIDDEFVGKTVRVVRAIGGGGETGKVELKGAEWNARCEVALAVGSSAVVVQRDGIQLIVKPSS